VLELSARMPQTSAVNCTVLAGDTSSYKVQERESLI